MLRRRSRYFYEAGIEKYNQYSKKRLKSDKDLRYVIGYIIEQSLELLLKHIAFELTDDYPENHKIYKIVNHVRNGLKVIEVEDEVSLLRMLEYLDEHSRLFDNLAYGAKYFPNVPFQLEHLEDLIYRVDELYRWYIMCGYTLIERKRKSV